MSVTFQIGHRCDFAAWLSPVSDQTGHKVQHCPVGLCAGADCLLVMSVSVCLYAAVATCPSIYLSVCLRQYLYKAPGKAPQGLMCPALLLGDFFPPVHSQSDETYMGLGMGGAC